MLRGWDKIFCEDGKMDQSIGEKRQALLILGCTGSVGSQALSVADFGHYPVEGISAFRDVKGAEKAARRFGVHYVAMGDTDAAADLRTRLRDTDITVYAGEEGICQMIRTAQADIVLNAILGEAGLMPTFATLQSGKQLALANKESLVIAGNLVMPEAHRRGIRIRPVDSEHCAIAQCLAGGEHREIRRLLLTASGGPFFGYTSADLKKVRVEDALAHPSWHMGAKITIDSATMMNKGFEIMEAAYLFDVPQSSIEVVVHRESIIHSMVEYIDHSTLAQLAIPDMRLCIQHAISWPTREKGCVSPLDWTKISKLTFAEPDEATFPLLPLARRSFERSGAVPATLNAANEVAVAEFLGGKLSFNGIFDAVTYTVEHLETAAAQSTTLEEFLAYDREARRVTEEWIEKSKRTSFT